MKIILLALALMMTACGFEQVDEGYRGIYLKFGHVEGEPLVPGLHFYNPITSSVKEISVREEKFEGKTDCFTKDTQTVTVTFALTLYPDQKQIGQIYSQFGWEWEKKIVEPTVLGSLKDAIGQYIADELVSKRDVVRKNALAEIKSNLATRGIIATDLNFTNLDFNDEYERAVEAKVAAVQKAAEAKNKTVEIEEMAKQKVKTAEADATAMRIKSQALAQNKGLVQFEAVQKWDGHLPHIILGNNSMPILDLKNLTKEEK